MLTDAAFSKLSFPSIGAARSEEEFEHARTRGHAAGYAAGLRQAALAAEALRDAAEADKTVESLTEFFKEVDGMRAPVPDDELSRGKNLEALSFPGTFETTGDMTGQLADLVVYNLPDTFFNEYVPKIQAVTAADLQRTANRFLQSNAFVVVVAGDLAKIEQPIRAANFGVVTVIKADNLLK